MINHITLTDVLQSSFQRVLTSSFFCHHAESFFSRVQASRQKGSSKQRTLILYDSLHSDSSDFLSWILHRILHDRYEIWQDTWYTLIQYKWTWSSKESQAQISSYVAEVEACVSQLHFQCLLHVSGMSKTWQIAVELIGAIYMNAVSQYVSQAHCNIVDTYQNPDSLVWSSRLNMWSKQIWYSQSAQKFWLEPSPQTKIHFAASLSPCQPSWASMMWMSVASAFSWGWTSMCHRIRLILPRALVSRILPSWFLMVSCFWSQSVLVYVFYSLASKHSHIPSSTS